MNAETAVVVGCKEIAERLGVTQNLVATWKRRGLLPAEDHPRVGGRPAWWLRTIDEWDSAGRPAAGGVGELVDR